MDKNNIQQIEKCGSIASFVGIVANLLLAGCKVVVGAIFGVISVLADGLNNLTDCGSSIISVISFKLSARPADKEHPYGHERIEYVCSLIVAFLVAFVAIDTAKESIAKIISYSEIEFSYIILLVLAFSVLTKLFLFFYYKSVAKKINSSILSASAVDCLTDCISTAVVAVSCIVGKFWGVNIDGYAGIVVALFIGWSAINILKDIFSKLIGQAPEKEMLAEIKQRILSHEGVLDVHDLSVYSYGPNKYFASAHVEVDASVDVMVSHELVDDIERDFIKNTNIVLTGHLDPIVTDNAEVNDLKEKVLNAVAEVSSDFSVHDFRVVFGKRHTNVLFDVAIPYETKMTTSEINERISKAVKEIDEKYCAVITVEYCI